MRPIGEGWVGGGGQCDDSGDGDTVVMVMVECNC